MFPYIHYSGFEHRVLLLINNEHYEAHKHLLPSVDITQRDRFLYALERCNDIPSSTNWVKKGAALPGPRYNKFIGFMASHYEHKPAFESVVSR